MKFKKFATIAVAVTMMFVATQAPCCEACEKAGKVPKTNFYKMDGALDVYKAKKAYLKLAKRYNLSIHEVLFTDNFEVYDFQQGEFENLGMAGILRDSEKNEYVTKKISRREENNSLSYDIYVLSGQCTPEQRYVSRPAVKNEWYVRAGSTRFFCEKSSGNGEKLISNLPKEKQPWGFGEEWFKCNYYIDKEAGESWTLSDVTGYHFVQAGSKGCVITKPPTSQRDIRFSKACISFENTKAKTKEPADYQEDGFEIR